MAHIEINPARLDYLLKLFDFSKEQLDKLAEKLNFDIRNLENPISKTKLQEIDKIFKKGLDFYTNPTPIKSDNLSSILFRKNNLKDELEIGDKQLIVEFESQINYINAIAKLSGFSFTQRKLERFSIKHNPQEVAKKMQNLLSKSSKDRDFLKAFIESLAKQNILVLEKINHSKATYKSNLCGFFIKPNIIILNRQKSTKREIFTLAHELGHYLIDSEHIDKDIFQNSSNDEEKWCNEFAFYLLVGECLEDLDSIHKAQITIDNQTIRNISKKKHISRLAIFCHYAGIKKIQWEFYKELKNHLDEEYSKQKTLKKDNTKFCPPKPLLSPLKKDIFLSAFFEGVIDEYVMRREFKTYIKEQNLDGFVYGG